MTRPPTSRPEAAPSGPPARAPHDAAYKALFDHPRMIEDLVRGFAPPALAGLVDFGRTRRLPAGHVDGDMRRRHGDMAWLLGLKEGVDDGAAGLLLVLEFQSTRDALMARRMLSYVALAYDRLERGGDLPGARLPPVLPMVLYNGRERWTAARDVGETVAMPGGGLEPLQPRLRHVLVDFLRADPDSLPDGNAVSALVALEQGDVEMLRRLGAVAPGPEHRGLRRTFGRWLLRSARWARLAAGIPGIEADLERMAEEGELEPMGSMMAERFDEVLDKAVAKAAAEAAAEAAAKAAAEAAAEAAAKGWAHERALLARLAARKFGEAAAARLSELIEGVEDPERLEEIGMQVLACDDGDAFVARARDAAGRG